MKRQPRVHDPDHLAFIRQCDCLCCYDNISTEAAHIRFSEPRIAKFNPGVGQKPDDKFVVPLCGSCHRSQHDAGNERKWWDERNINSLLVALALYSVSGDHEKAAQIIAANRPINVLEAR